MKQTTLSLDSETACKLKALSELSHISQTNIIREWVSLLYSLVGDSKRISLMSYDAKKNNVIVTRIAKIEVGCGEIP